MPVVLATCLAAASVGADEAPGIYAAYWDYELAQNPFQATLSGDYRFNDRVPDVGDKARRARLKTLGQFASQLGASAGESLYADILRFILRHELALGEFAPWRIPFLSDAGFHMDVGYVVSSTRFESFDDYRDYLARLSALPGYLEQNRVNMQFGIEAGFTQPRKIMENILVSFDAQVTESTAISPGPGRHLLTRSANSLSGICGMMPKLPLGTLSTFAISTMSCSPPAVCRSICSKPWSGSTLKKPANSKVRRDETCPWHDER